MYSLKIEGKVYTTSSGKVMQFDTEDEAKQFASMMYAIIDKPVEYNIEEIVDEPTS